MNIDAQTFSRIAKPIVAANAKLAPSEAHTIVQLAYLAYGADLDEDSSERSMLDQLGNSVCALGGIEFADVPRPSPLPLPIDDEARMAWLEDLGKRLTTTTARELAYVVAAMVIMGDLQLSPVESLFLAELREELRLDAARADELVSNAAEQLTS
jgi:hypothetical protein